jgi:hypothetical protein
MIFKKQIEPSPLLILGLFALAIANASHFFLPRIIGTNTDSLDFVFGLLMGVAIALLLLAVVCGRRSKLKR